MCDGVIKEVVWDYFDFNFVIVNKICKRYLWNSLIEV